MLSIWTCYTSYIPAIVSPMILVKLRRCLLLLAKRTDEMFLHDSKSTMDQLIWNY